VGMAAVRQLTSDDHRKAQLQEAGACELVIAGMRAYAADVVRCRRNTEVRGAA
jgi:hypothetical protein